LRVDPPLLVAPLGEALVPGGGRGKLPTAPRPGSVALAIEVLPPRQGQAPEAPGEDPDGQAEGGATRPPPCAIRRDAPGGEDTMPRGVMREGWAPGGPHGNAPQLRAKRLGGPGAVLQRLGDGAQAEPREQTWVLECQGPQGVRPGDEDVGGGRVEPLTLPGGQPCGLGGAMACRAATVAAGVVRLDRVATLIALGEVASQGGRPAHRESPQRPMRLTREGGPSARQPGVAMLGHAIGHCQLRPTPGRLSRSAGQARASRGRAGADSAGWATGRARRVRRRRA
jgi:hypothetical protein